MPAVRVAETTHPTFTAVPSRRRSDPLVAAKHPSRRSNCGAAASLPVRRSVRASMQLRDSTMRPRPTRRSASFHAPARPKPIVPVENPRDSPK